MKKFYIEAEPFNSHIKIRGDIYYRGREFSQIDIPRHGDKDSTDVRINGVWIEIAEIRRGLIIRRITKAKR